MHHLKISLLVFILQISLISQAPDTIWTKIIGEELSEDWGISFIEANDSGYVIVGATLKESPEDLRIFKTDKNGNLIWSKTYGSENYIEQAWSIKKTLDDNFIVCGTKTVPPLNGNIWLLKFKTNGDTLWTKNFSGTGNVFGRSVEPTRDGGSILLGETVTVFFDLGLIMIKTNSIGEITWTKYFDQTASLDGNYIVKETIDKKYVVLSTVNKANSDVYLFKTDSNGDTIWTRTYGGIGKEVGECIIETSDGGFIITGYADPPISIHQDDLWVFKTNSSGEVIWSKTFGADTTEEKGTWLIETPNNEYLIVGERQLEACWDIWILRINSMGDTLWTRTIGGANNETAYSVLLTSDNEYLVLGWSASFGFSNV